MNPNAKLRPFIHYDGNFFIDEEFEARLKKDDKNVALITIIGETIEQQTRFLERVIGQKGNPNSGDTIIQAWDSPIYS